MESVNCPLCEGKSELFVEKKTSSFRTEDFDVFEYYYACKNCKEKFTTAEIDHININNVYNQYREKYSIPFPQQLIAARERYNLSAAKMSEILGLGANQYRLYENGEMPSSSTATLLSLIMNPVDFKEIIQRKKDILKNSKRILDNLIDLILKNKVREKELKQILFDNFIIPNRYTGFSVPNYEKFANMVLYFIHNASMKTRLNKLLFYSDFASYKYTGYSISGCKYIALPMGTVPCDYGLIFGLLESENYLTNEFIIIKEKETEKIVSLKPFNPNLFTSAELNILETVLKKFKSLSTPELIKIAHDEKAWLDNVKHKAIIDFTIYAPQLSAL